MLTAKYITRRMADHERWLTLQSMGEHYKWKYQDISDPAFANHQNLQFGFRWVNGTRTDTATSFGIDDIKLVGTYDPVRYPIHISVSQVIGVPACQNSSIYVGLTLSAPLCGVGNYFLEISGPGGNFSKTIFTGGYSLNNENLTPFLIVPIASSTLPDTCYRIRVTRTDLTPPIFSDTSICFRVMVCSNTITTLQPVVIPNPLDTSTAICVNSVIDVPFLSTGVFINNTYIAQLSDSSGNFTKPINVLGSLHSSQTFPGPPGTVSGKIVPSINQPIPPGCNYFIRVISTSPADTGSVFGPFCIRDCNLQTNNTLDIHVCLPPGIDTCFPIQINHFHDSTLAYAPANGFQVEVHSSMDFSLLNKGGLGGIVVSDSDTCLHLVIPNLAFFSSLGLAPGLYYIRIVADSSNEPWNMLGTLVRLTVGSPFPSPLTILFKDPISGITRIASDTSICLNNVIGFYLSPDNSPKSTYSWTWNNKNDFTSLVNFNFGFNGTGNYAFSVVETNFGCVGPGSDVVNVHVLGLPSVVMSGPTQACVGDTVHYSVPLENNTYYQWSSPTGTILDTANNNLDITFRQPGFQTIKIIAVGQCGDTSRTRTIDIKAYPVVNAGNDTTVCKHDTVNLSTPSGTYTYLWSTGATTRNITVTPDSTTTYTIATKLNGPAACTSYDTVVVTVQNPNQAQFNDSICPKQPLVLDPGIAGASYVWSTGNTTQTITVKDSGTYILSFKLDTAVCRTKDTYTVKLTYLYPPGNGTDTAICPPGEVSLDAGQAGGVYYWSTNDTSQIITVHDTGIYTLTILDKTGKCNATRIYRVNDLCAADSISYPNVITPNGDGFNDTWHNKYDTYFNTFNVKIWDRWGAFNL